MTLAHKFVRTTLTCIALVAVVPSTVHAEATTETTRAQARIDFRILVPALTRVRAITQPTKITVEPAHIAQGYLDLDGASLLALTSNDRQGYQLAVRYEVGLLERIELRIGDQHVEATSGHASVRLPAPTSRSTSVSVGYRLFLAPGVAVGTYAWPVALMFSTLAL